MGERKYFSLQKVIGIFVTEFEFSLNLRKNKKNKKKKTIIQLKCNNRCIAVFHR